MPNIFAPEWTERTDPGLVGRISRVGAQAGSLRLGATVYEIAPGAVSSPFHAHHAPGELIIVLAGSLMLRTPETERPLASGEVVSCPAGGRGAHQLRNETSEPVRVIVISTMVYPEIVEMPDSDKLVAQSAPPGTADRIALAFPRAAQVDRLAGEPSSGAGVET